MLSVKAEKNNAVLNAERGKPEECEGGRIERAITDAQTITQQHTHIIGHLIGM